ncbi:nucleoside triphosphate pyrophosphohydrolase [Clostridium algidicarnis]|uniref:nucleoside triphosphate pyrophosphohydrolase n=1 Tax=Clostridium algidicarnis TaxID=37659 RepID=UPI001C0C66E2|nr:nucleoside triphosphate pyrophosphohydrolase [Clostridium algidicarnis]MBU3206530.1 nucleoside triphosphate pyrophosphohydrolase [Clostridium algidicarnis]
MIKILGLGPGSPEALTLGTLNELKSGKDIYLRTEKHPTVDYIKSMDIKVHTYDFAYDKFDSFDKVYQFIAEDLIKRHNIVDEVIYAVPGHPLVAERTVNILIDLCENQGIAVEIVPAVSFIDVIIERLKIDPINGLKIIDAFDVGNQNLDNNAGLIITQVYDQLISSEVKIRLLDYYHYDKEIYFVRAAGVKGEESIRKIPLYTLDRQADIDYLTSLYIPKGGKENKGLSELLDIMEKLRSEEGCPWDREQTHESLKRYLVEESYEVIEAIEEKDDEKIIEELGDVLLQVVFHAVIGKEEGYFNINDIINSISKKMIDRHPHVFGDTKVDNSIEVMVKWEEIKSIEKGYSTVVDAMEHIAKSLPSLIRAEKVQSKAKKVGFDFNVVDGAMDKIIEEFYELKEVYKGSNEAIIEEEMGDLIFSCVNVARMLGIDSELALNKTINKFIKRFKFMEDTAKSKEIKLEQMSLEEMDQLWNLSKSI